LASTLNSDNGAVSGSAGLKSSADATGVLALQTNGTTAISISAAQVVSLTSGLAVTGTLTTTGNAGVGTTTLDERLNVVNTGTFAAVRVSNGTNSSYFGYAQSDGNYNAGAKAGDAFIRGHAGVSIESSGGTSGIRVNTSGNLQTFGTVSVGNATPSASGAGITFPATQSASTDANTLDDYEEGTWTPLISANGDGVDNWTSSSATGRYTKVGRLVTVECFYTYTAKQTVTGDYAFMTGLPFTPANGASGNGFFYVGINNSGGADTATYSGVFETAPRVQFVKDQNRSGAGFMVGSDFPAATRTITFQANYTV